MEFHQFFVSTISTDVFIQTKNIILILLMETMWEFSWQKNSIETGIKYGSRDELEREIERILKYTVDSFGMDLSLQVYFFEVFMVT